MGRAHREAIWIDPKTCVSGTLEVDLSDLVQSVDYPSASEGVFGTTDSVGMHSTFSIRGRFPI